MRMLVVALVLTTASVASAQSSSSTSSKGGAASTKEPASTSASPEGASLAPVGASGTARPLGKTFGLGIALGAPVGLAGKVFIADAAALSFDLGFWSTEYGGGTIDFLYHPLGNLGDGSYGAP
jgi:hypothetical protein